MNDENLIPMSRRSESEVRELGRKGGKASGAARRAQKSLKQAAKVFFQENENATMAIIQALYTEAISGNVKAIERLQDLIGETVQREELALKKKALASANKTDNGKALMLIEALMKDGDSCVHEEAEAAHEAVADEEA